MAIQQMLLGAGKPPTKYYIDDVFSMDPYLGKTAYPYNVLGNVITTGLKIKDEGGFVWIKNREGTQENLWFSPAMGVGKNITPASAAAMVTQGGRITQYKDDGFKLATDTSVNENGKDLMSWSFKNNKGFFELVEWTGNGTARTISHGLGCKPGFIAVKSMSQGGNWTTWHRGMNKGDTPHNYYQRLNVGGGLQSDYQPFTAEPTSTGFAIIADNSNDYEAYMNKSGETYKAWVWAGGASDAATAKSFSFAADVCLTDSSSNYTLGTSDFTLEYWYKADPNPSSGNYSYIVDYNDDDWATRVKPDGTHQYMVGDTARITSTTPLCEGQWHHIAIVRSSGTSRMYINGVQEGGTYSDSTNYSFTQFYMGRRYNGTNQLYGKVSNLRLVVGTAVYTSSFRPPTEPLTNITNTKLLGLNSSSLGATVGTIQGSGNTDLNPTASNDTPFDDPGNFIFGDGGKQNIIKTGYYIGNGDGTNGLEVELGFEPQFVWIKADGTTSDANYNWLVFDTMRTMDNRKHDNTHDSGRLYSSNNGAEVTTDDGINVLPTGFKIQGNNDDRNGDGHQYIYIAIRASEGYVSKVPAAGSDVFAMDTGNSSSDEATFDSGFPVDFGLKRSLGGDNWAVHSRLMGKYWLTADSSGSQYSENGSKFDSAVGMLKTGNPSSVYGWMWKRHAGFDCVAVKPNSAGDHIPHNLNAVPEMIWAKDRGQSAQWSVYHKGLNGGTNPEQYRLKLNANDEEQDTANAWNDEAPTSTHFTVGSWTGGGGNEMMFMLFASVDGISKCGFYTGNGTSDSSTQTITTGFQPRFVIIKSTSNDEHWVTFDTFRGWSSGSSDQVLELNNADAQNTNLGDIGHPISTGFVLEKDESVMNLNNHKYLYYAHA